MTATNATGAGPAATTAAVLPHYPVVTDFDADLDTDISVFPPSSGSWFSNDGFAAQYGADGDIPVPGDYDGRKDRHRRVPAVVGTSYIHNSATNTDTLLNYGVETDIRCRVTTPVTGAASSPSTGPRRRPTWPGAPGTSATSPTAPTPSSPSAPPRATSRSSATTTATTRPTGGSSGPPLAGGLCSSPRAARRLAPTGRPTTSPCPATGTPTPRPTWGSTGTWFVNFLVTGTDSLLTYGVGSDQAQPSDYNGDGPTDIAIDRRTTPTNLAGGTWYIRNLSNGTDTIARRATSSKAGLR